MLCAIPRFMDSSEAVTEQILGVQAFYILQFFWKMTLRRVVAKYMLYNVPCFLAASNNPALKLAEWLGIRIVAVIGIC